MTAYTQVQGDIPVSLTDGTFVSIERQNPLKIHQLGFQPARSIPEIPRWFLQKYVKPGMAVLEPFAGSGTSIIEGLRHGAWVYWLDYHPLSRLVCRAKMVEFSCREMKLKTAEILQKAAVQKNAPTTIFFANKDFWFQKPVQEGLEIIREHILQVPAELQPALWLAFAATVRKTSDMNDGMLLAAKRPHVKEIPQRSRGDVFHYFQEYVDKATEALEEWGQVANGLRKKAVELPEWDARRLMTPSLLDAVITSPPYVNAIDYVWAAKFELHWLGLVSSDEDRLNLYEKEIGTERIPRRICQEIGRTGYHELDVLIEDIFRGKKYQASKGQNGLRSRVVYQYFTDMKKHFTHCLGSLRPGGYYCFTVGDRNRICGVEIPVASLLAHIACDIGFEKKFQFHLLLKNRKLNVPRNVKWAGVIQHDTTIVLQKPVL